MGIRILIADDYTSLREAVGFRLKAEPDLEVIAEAADGRMAVHLVRELSPDVVVMDVTMPNLSGIEATRQICRDQPSTKVIAFSGAMDQHSVQEMLAAGASGYVLKSSPFEELLVAIRQVVANHAFLTPRICTLVVDGYVNRSGGSGGPAGSRLTSRENEVLQAIAEGKSTKTIARELSVSTKTVEWHRSRMMRKLGIDTIAGLVRYAIAEGISGLEPATLTAI